MSEEIHCKVCNPASRITIEECCKLDALSRFVCSNCGSPVALTKAIMEQVLRLRTQLTKIIPEGKQ